MCKLNVYFEKNCQIIIKIVPVFLSICQAIESLKEEGPFSKSFLSNVVSAVGNVASINNVVSLIDQYGQSTNQTNPNSSPNTSSQRFALSQLLSSIGSDSSSSSSSSNRIILSLQNKNEIKTESSKASRECSPYIK